MMTTLQSLSQPTKHSSTPGDVVPYTMRLPGGRHLYVSLPAAHVTERDGEIFLLPPAVRRLDSLQALALKVESPTPGHITALRKALGMTQAKFASTLRVDKATVYRWEHGHVIPKPESVAAIERLRARHAKRGVMVET